MFHLNFFSHILIHQKKIREDVDSTKIRSERFINLLYAYNFAYLLMNVLTVEISIKLISRLFNEWNEDVVKDLAPSTYVVVLHGQNCRVI